MEALEYKFQLLLETEQELMKLKATLKAVHKHNEEIKQNLAATQFKENDEDLRNHSKQCDLMIKAKTEDLKRIQEELKTLNHDSVILQEQHLKLYKKEVKLQNAAENLDIIIQEKDDFCERLKELKFIKEFRNDEDCVRELEELVRVLESELELMKVENEEEDKKLNEELNKVSLKSNIIHEKINSTSLNLTQTKKGLSDIGKKVSSHFLFKNFDCFSSRLEVLKM